MYKSIIGSNAGVVWRTLHNHKTVSMEELVNLTGLTQIEVACTIGWLAREDKIMIYQKENVMYLELLFHENYY